MRNDEDDMPTDEEDGKDQQEREQAILNPEHWYDQMEPTMQGLQRRYLFAQVTSGAAFLKALDSWIHRAKDQRIEAVETGKNKQQVEALQVALCKTNENGVLLKKKFSRAEATYTKLRTAVVHANVRAALAKLKGTRLKKERVAYIYSVRETNQAVNRLAGVEAGACVNIQQ